MLTFEGKSIFDIIHGPNVHNIFVISQFCDVTCVTEQKGGS